MIPAGELYQLTLPCRVSHQKYSALRTYFVYLYLFGLFGGFASIKLKDNSFSLSFIAFPILYLISLAEIRPLISKSIFVKAVNLMLFVFAGLCITSTLSFNPIKSFTAIVSLIFNFLFAFWLSQNYTKEDFLLMVLNVLKISLFISVVLLLIYPDLVIYFDPLERESIIGLPNFKGLAPHKIHAGVYNSLGYILASLFYKRTKEKKYIYLAFAFFVSVLASGSSLAFATLIAIILLSPVIRILSKNRSWLVFILITIVLFVSAAFLMMDSLAIIFQLLGRDATLTGRTTIWEFGVDYFMSHPFFGGGFESFFEDAQNSPASALWEEMPFYKAPSFHNGFLELLAEAGLIGGASFILIYLRGFSNALKFKDNLMISIFVLFSIANTASAMLIKPNSFFFTFLIFWHCAVTMQKRKNFIPPKYTSHKQSTAIQ